MAQMIPETPRRGTGEGARAEAILFEVLAKDLPNEFFVYHHLTFLEETRAAEGEADFLVLNRKQGMLLIECKGSGVHRTGSGEWFRMENQKEVRMQESPFDQAERSRWNLVKELQNRSQKAFPRITANFPFVHGHAVAFPLANFESGSLPLGANRGITFFQSDLPDIGKRVMDAMEFWAQKVRPPEPLSEKEFKRFRKDVLHPHLYITTKLGEEIEGGRQQMIRLSQEQVQPLKGLACNQRIRVKGGAGTGKTLLALEFARKLAGEGKKALIVCFNESLADYLRKEVGTWESSRDRVEVRHFHGMCLDAYRVLGRDFHLPDPRDAQAAGEFWNGEAPCALVEALAGGDFPRWDAIVADEGQDFKEDWWKILENCLVDREKGHLAIFCDPSQDIFGSGCHLPACSTELPLTTNFRNTRKVAEFVKKLGKVSMESPLSCLEGRDVTVKRYKTLDEELEILGNLVKELIEVQRVNPGYIAILTPHSPNHSVLRGKNKLVGYPLVFSSQERNEVKDAILHMSIYKFKGLESEVVILADIDPEDDLCKDPVVYSGASRACQSLYILASKGWQNPGDPSEK